MSVSVFSISTIILAILFSTLLMNRLRLPFVLGVLLAGALFGPASPLAGISLAGFSTDEFLIKDTTLVDLFATIGALLILFQIGLEFSLKKLERLGFGPVFAAFIKLGLVFLLGFLASTMLFGFSRQAGLFIGVIISMSSTPIIVKILQEKGFMQRKEVPLVIAILVIEDIFAVFSLSVLSSMVNEGLTPMALPLSILKTIAAFVFAYILLTAVLKRFFKFIAYSDEALLLTTLAVAVGAGYALEQIGLSAPIGAFLAGSVLASLPEAKKIEDGIRNFTILFSAIFFFSIGMMIDVNAIEKNLGLAVVFTIIALFGKFAGASISAYFTGMRGKSSSFVGVAMLTLSEVSLLVAKEGASLKVIDVDILSISSAVLFASVAVTSLLVNREERVYAACCRILPSELLWMGRRTAAGLQEIRKAVFAQQRMRAARPLAYEKLLKSSLEAITFGVAAVFLFALAVIIAPGATLPVLALMALLEAGAIASLLLGALRVKSSVDTVLRAVLAEEGTAGTKFVSKVALALLFIVLAFLSPVASAFVHPVISLGAAMLFLLMALFYVWDASKKARQIIEDANNHRA